MSDEPQEVAPPQPQLTRAERRARWWTETKVDLKWAVALLFVLILGISGYLWSAWDHPTDGVENLDKITDLVFGPLVAPFEVLSVLLLAALIAGVAMAFRDPEGGM